MIMNESSAENSTEYVSPTWDRWKLRCDTLPLRKNGRIEYFFRPKSTHAARIYVFIHAELWRSRNRRPMGLFFAAPFLSRPMSSDEIQYHKYDTRLKYYQYENFDNLITDELEESHFLDLDRRETSCQFISKLKLFIEKYKNEK